MSKANQRRADCFHEAGHAVMAWVQGVRISSIRLVPESEEGVHSAQTLTVPGALSSMADAACRMRTTLAGTFGERLGPAPEGQRDVGFAKWEREQHYLQAAAYARQLLEAKGQELTRLVLSAEKDVDEVFQKPHVARCVERLARLLLERGELSGPEAERFIASQITEEQRAALWRECCLTGRDSAELESLGLADR